MSASCWNSGLCTAPRPGMCCLIRQYTEITELDESILFELVDRIEVGETQKVGGQRICDLRVYYRYVGNVDAALTQEERRQPLEEAI